VGTVVQWHGSWIEIYLPVCNQYISPLKFGVCLYSIQHYVSDLSDHLFDGV
jgi:hypothetical protein